MTDYLIGSTIQLYIEKSLVSSKLVVLLVVTSLSRNFNCFPGRGFELSVLTKGQDALVSSL